MGMGIGYRSSTWSYTTNNPNEMSIPSFKTLPFGWEATIGARYFFTPNIGIYAEIGLAKAIFQLGLTGRF